MGALKYANSATILSRIDSIKCSTETPNLRELQHPFNLKGGGGGYGFFRSKNILFSLRSSNLFRDIIFFISTKTIFFKTQSANRNFISAHFRDRIFFQSNL